MEAGFVTWDMLKEFATLSSIVFMVTMFTKELKFIKNIPTKYYSAIVALLLVIGSNLHFKTFKILDLLIYALTAMLISLNANSINDFHLEKSIKQKEEIKTEANSIDYSDFRGE